MRIPGIFKKKESEEEGERSKFKFRTEKSFFFF